MARTKFQFPLPGQHQELLGAALLHAEEGRPVFPCDPKTRRPLTKNGFHDASSDPSRIERWWRQEFPGAAIGVPTGPRAGFWVLDIDPRHGGDASLAKLEQEREPLPPTMASLTPGGGTHFFFRWDEAAEIRNSESEIAQGIDVRGNGGYAILPPSVRPDGNYRWHPDCAALIDPPEWLTDLALKKPKHNGAEKPKKANGSNGADHSAWAQAALEREAAAVATASEGTRNGTLNRAAFSLAQIVAGGGLDEGGARARLTAAARAAGLSPNEIARTLDSAFAAGQEQPRGPKEKENNAGDQTPRNAAGALQSVRASQIEIRAIDWLWQDRFALGKLGLVVGLPDEGKGQILCDMAGRITRGDQWPCGEGVALLGNVILLTAEDDPADTVVPRLKAAGADLDRVEIVKMVHEQSKQRLFSLVCDLDLLRQKIIEVGNVRQVQIDPVSAYLGVGKVDSFRTTDVRAVLAPLVELAAELHVSMVGIMHFNKKVDVTNALLRISDSLAFGATARHVYAAIDDPENKRKLLVRGKNNVGKRDQQALAYGFGVSEVGFDPRLNKPIEAPHITWLGHVDVSATEAMQAATDNRSPSARDEAKRFLVETLAGGPAPASEIEEAAEANGISQRTLFRAKNELGVLAKKDGFDGGWTWQMPTARKPGGEP